MKMTLEYMIDLHKFLRQFNNTDVVQLENRVQEHLKFIPRGKLYRYRRATNREIEMLCRQSVWLSDPNDFPDVCDATIPIEDEFTIGFDYGFCFTAELAYRALVDTAEEGERIPTKEQFMQAMWAAKEEYGTLDKLQTRTKEIYGDEYEDVRRTLDELALNSPISKDIGADLTNNAFKLLSHLSQWPRNNMCISSFTTDKDSRNMWEGYANNYTGFCVEYDFRRIAKNLDAKSAWDILHLLPVRYCKTRPLLNHKPLIYSMVQEDTKAGRFGVNIDDYLIAHYQAVTTKLACYRTEKEWRLIMSSQNLGGYHFPYISAIYLGKDMPERKINKMVGISRKLSIPIYLQVPANHNDAFEYIQLPQD